MSCIANSPVPFEAQNAMIVGKEKIARIFSKEGFFILNKASLMLPNNKTISLTQEMADEIRDNAIALLVTGVDLSTDIWAIQWENDYVMKSF